MTNGRSLTKSVVMVALTSALLTAHRPAHAELATVALEWRPAIEIGDLGPIDLTGLGDVGVQVLPLEDSRAHRQQIGARVAAEPRDAAGEEQAVTTAGHVAEFVTDRLIHLLEEMGLTVVAAGGTVLLEGEIRRFSVRESSLYEAEVVLALRLRTPDAETLWEATVAGGSSRYGPPGLAETYQEALSDALFEAVHQLVTDPEAAQAMRQEAAAPAGR